MSFFCKKSFIPKAGQPLFVHLSKYYCIAFFLGGIFWCTNLLELHMVSLMSGYSRKSDNIFEKLSSSHFFLFQCFENRDFVSVGNALSRLCMFLPIFALICNLGEMVTTAFEDMNETVYAMAWNLYPLDLRKYFILILAATQQPIIMEGIFSLDCSRTTFKRVSFFINISIDDWIISINWI